MWWWVLGVLVGLLVLNLLVHIFYARVAMPFFEVRPPFQVADSPPNDDGEPIEFPTTDNLTLRGRLYRPEGNERNRSPSRGVVIFSHELGGNHWSVMNYARGLLEAGFHLVTFDMRNHGESDPQAHYEPMHWLTTFEVEDLRSALRFVRSHPELSDLPLGLFGISRGGCTSLAVAALHPDDVVCVAADSAYDTHIVALHYTLRWLGLMLPRWIARLIPDWHVLNTLRVMFVFSGRRRRIRYFNLYRNLRKLKPKPVFLIAGRRDSYIQSIVPKTMIRKMGHPQDDLWIASGAKHNMARSLHAEEYDRRLTEFFVASMEQATKPERSGVAVTESV